MTPIVGHDLGGVVEGRIDAGGRVVVELTDLLLRPVGGGALAGVGLRCQRGRRRCELGVDDLDHEAQRIAGLDDAAGATVAVREVGGDVELAAATLLDADESLVPAGDDRCPRRG